MVNMSMSLPNVFENTSRLKSDNKEGLFNIKFAAFLQEHFF